ncbi:hypothetical protein JKF63_07228 [Porcisia hertigi]|uniref:MYND-type domain-containing protein n=1 Tax=Porcisia hertigi TaxID=2761500 RepID=A0A836LL98_9TRYP|nr:hypothetical protein JKF63_07228 [Porcisia hertigi]
MPYPRPAPSQKGEAVADGRSSSSSSSNTQDSLHVPSPEHTWTQLMLGGLPSGITPGAAPAAPPDYVRERRDEAVTPELSRPSLAELLPTLPIPLSGNAPCTPGGVHGPKRRRGEAATDTVQPVSLCMVSESSPSVRASGETVQGLDEDHDDATASSFAHQQFDPTQLPATYSGSPQPDPSASGRSKTRGGADFFMPPAQRIELLVPSSFTDLFVGLERPRLHGRRPLEQSQRHHRTHSDNDINVDASASLSSSSPSLALDQISSIKSHDDIIINEDALDEDGADTPTVYRGSQLPHWWRSMVTPVPGTRVSLRPGTRRLEFWWIDRLGSEAYEIIRILLKHAVEGVVLRRSGETAVVVEFRIPAHLLKSTSYSVERRWCAQRDMPPGLAAGGDNASESASMPFLTEGGASSLAGSQIVDTAETAILRRSPSQTSYAGGGRGKCSQREPATTATNDATSEATYGGRDETPPFTQTFISTAPPRFPPPDLQQPEAMAPFPRPLSACSSLSLADDSTAVTAIGQLTDSLVEQKIDRMALTYVDCTTTTTTNSTQPHEHELFCEEPLQMCRQTGPVAATVMCMTPAGAGGHGKVGVNSSAPTNASRIISRAEYAVDSAEPMLSGATQANTVSPLRCGPSSELRLSCDRLPLAVEMTSVAAKGTEPAGLHGDIKGSSEPHFFEDGTPLAHGESHHRVHKINENQRRSGDPVAVSLFDPVCHVSPPPSGHSDHALPDRLNGNWHHGSWRAQEPHHHHSSGSPNKTAKAAAAATAEALHLEDDTAPTNTTTTASPSQQWQRPALLGTHQPVVAEDDDSVVAILTLPTSMCTPIIVVRLHAMRLLHPLLRAIAARHSPAVSTNISRDYRCPDNTDNESTDEAGLSAGLSLNVTPLSSTVGSAKGHDYASALHIFNKAIELLEKEKGLGGEEVPRPPPTTTTPNHKAPTRARDLSILYTVRSHLLFHASPMYLRDSLHDAERALRSCPARDHVNPTYEILAANLISFGFISHLDALTGYLRHRWRAASPLLLRLGRVIQVMVSYTSLFLRQQLPTSTLRLCNGGNTSPLQLSTANDTTVSLLPPLPNGGEGMLRNHLRDIPTADASVKPLSIVLPITALSDDAVKTATDRPHHSPPPFTPQAAEDNIRHRGARQSWRAVPAAGTDTAAATRLQADSLPYEVCPLLLGGYGMTFHALDEPLLRMPMPLTTTTAPRADTGSAEPMQHHRYPTRPLDSRSSLRSPHQPSRTSHPGTDVCVRRLFLLRTLFPSMNPKPVSQLPCPIPRKRRHVTRRQNLQSITQPRGTKTSIGDGGKDNNPRTSTILVPRSNSGQQVRVEDLMYDRDSMFSLLAASADTTMKWGTVPMSYFCRHVRLSATRGIQRGETILMERPAVLMPLWGLLPPGSALACSAATPPPLCKNCDGARVSERLTIIPSAPSCCSYCGRQQLVKPVKCPGNCDSVYCSDQCRELALRLYHVVECGGVPPESDKARVLEPGKDAAARVRRTVAMLQDLFLKWNRYLDHLPRSDTPSTRLTASHVERSPMTAPGGVSPGSTPLACQMPGRDAPQPQLGGARGTTTPPMEKRSCMPPPFLAVTAMRMVARLLAMILSMVLPVEFLPQMQKNPTWTAERYEMMCAVSRTLRQRGLTVPLTSTSETTCANAHCTHVDPHQLLLLEVLLHQLSIPFFADFNYRSASTVWEGLGRIPCEAARDADKPAATPSLEKSVTSPVNNNACPDMVCKPPFDPTPSPITNEWQQQRNWFSALTPAQLEEVVCDLHSMVLRLYRTIAEEMVDVPSLPLSGVETVWKNGLEWGLPGRWSCVELLGFLTSTRALQQISDFAMTSWAVVYPRDMEPPNVAAAMATDSCGVSQSESVILDNDCPMNTRDGHHPTSKVTPTNKLSPANPSNNSGTAAVPLAVIGPWTCLTVDLHPILGNTPDGVIYSRFMVEHEQRRRMLAYCAAAAGCRGGDGAGGVGENEDSFLSVQSETSTSSAAALLANDDSAQTGSLFEDLNLGMLEEAAKRSCSNVHISIVYTPSKEPVVLVVAKKNINHSEALWWESLHFSEYLPAHP